MAPKILLVFFCFGLIQCAPSRAQSTGDSYTAFEIAKEPPQSGKTYHGEQSPTRIAMNWVSLKGMITTAYLIRDYQMSGGPDWMNEQLYNIDIRVSQPGEVIRVKLQKLIEEKFNLKFHREERDGPTYSLTLDEGGLKIHPLDPSVKRARNETRQTPKGAIPPGEARMSSDLGLYANAIPISGLEKLLFGPLKRQVVNKAGVAGLFDMDVKWPQRWSNPETAYSSISKALKEQLGLSLKPDRGRVEFFVIDAVQKPTGN